jgi:hypothetical protein
MMAMLVFMETSRQDLFALAQMGTALFPGHQCRQKLSSMIIAFE